MGGAFLADGSDNYQGIPSIACASPGGCLVVEQHSPLASPAGDIEIRGRMLETWWAYLPLLVR